MATTGITSRKYKSGSVIYFEGDYEDCVYILKSGTVILNSLKIDTGEEEREIVKPGEFFGVKSSLGKYPREETAQTQGDTETLILGPAEFERLVLGNVAVVQKMLRVFSNQLRSIGKSVRQVMGESEDEFADVENELFKIAEYYLKQGRHEQALYAYNRYLEYYPNGKNVTVIKNRISNMESGVGDSFDDVLSGDNELLTSDNYLGGDDDNFLAGSLDFDDVENDDFSFDFDEDQEISGGLGEEIEDFLDHEDSDEDKLAKGISFYKEEKYSEALDLLKQIEENFDEDIASAAKFYLASVNFALKEYKEAMNNFANLIKKYPNSGFVKKSYLQIGKIFLAGNQKNKAKAYLMKVVQMKPVDESNIEAKKLLTSL